MNSYKFVFDLDSTLTKKEILPEISKYLGCHEYIRSITEDSMIGKLSFEEGFIERVETLKQVPTEKVREIIRSIELNENLIKFIIENRDRCIIVTGNLDVWISELMDTLDMREKYYSSLAYEREGKVESIIKIIKKVDIVKEIKNPIVAIGDGSNDAEMIEYADIGIGFGGVRTIAPAVLDVCDYAFFEEEKLCQFLKRLL